MRLLRHRHALRAALVLLAIALLAYGLLAPSKRPAAAPALPRASLQGGPVTIGSLRGHAEAIVFFASWCTPCRKEAPAVARFARGVGRGRIVAIDYDDYGDARAFLRRYGWTFPVLSDPDGRTGAAYDLAEGLPSWIFIDARGEIVRRASGAQSVTALKRDLAAA